MFICFVGILYWFHFDMLLYIAIPIGYLLIMLLPEYSYPYIVLTIIANRALFGCVDFYYFYNFALLLMVLRALLVNPKRLKVKGVVLISLLGIFNITAMIWFKTFSMSNLVSLFSWLIGYLFVLCYLDDYRNASKLQLYKCFASGCLIGSICAIATLKYQYNFKLPRGFRFSGLFKEVNSFGLVCALLAVSSLCVWEKKSWKRYLSFVIFLGLGCLSLSKAYLVLVGIVIMFLCGHTLIKGTVGTKKQVVVKMSICLLALLLLFVVVELGMFDGIINLVDKYKQRFLNEEISSGRFSIWEHYIKKIGQSLFGILFGYGLNYNMVPGLAPNLGYEGKIYLAHCTYFDVLLSFGMLGTVVFLLIVNYVVKGLGICSLCGLGRKFVWKIHVLPLLTMLIGILSLSYLNGDYFIVLICYALVMLKTEKHSGEVEEVK